MMTRPSTTPSVPSNPQYVPHPPISDDELPLSEFARPDRGLNAPSRKQSVQRQTSTSRPRPHPNALPPNRPPSNQPTPTSRPEKTTAPLPRYKRKIGAFNLTKTLGAGSMGKVKLGIHETTGHKVAVKIIPRKVKHSDLAGRTQDEDVSLTDMAHEDKRVMREVSILSLLHHPYIVQLEDFVVTPHYYYLMFEYVEGGQLLDYIISHGKLNERTARKFSRQILSALDYCHRNSIVHRDLKIENILISNSGCIKIIDFGLSNLYSSKSHLSTFCGSLYFAAPELLCARAYTGPEVDIWSFGIVLYVLMCGEVPFDDKSMTVIHHKIKKGVVKYPSWLSPDCRHVISRLLVTNPADRAAMPEISQHPWINKGFHGPPDNHFPQRSPIDLPTDPEVIKKMAGFQFGSPESIRQQVESSILELSSRPPSASPSPKFPHKGSRDVQTPLSYPQLSVYHLVKEKMDRESKEPSQPRDYPASPLTADPRIRSSISPEPALGRSRSCRPAVGVSGRYPSINRHSTRKPNDPPSNLQPKDNGLQRALSDARPHPTSSSPHRPDFQRKTKAPSRQLSVKSDTTAPHHRPMSVGANLEVAAGPSKPQNPPIIRIDEAPPSSEPSTAKSPTTPKSPRRKPSRLERFGNLLTRGVSTREPSAANSPGVSSIHEESSYSDAPPNVTTSIPPVFIKGLFSVSSTSTKKPDVIRNEILRVLSEMNLTWREADGYISVSQPSASPSNGSSPVDNPSNQLLSASGSEGSGESHEDGEPISQEVSKTSDISPLSTKSSDQSTSGPHRRSKSLRQRFSLRRSVSKRSEHTTPLASPNVVKPPIPTNQPVRFEIQIVKLTLLRLHGVKFRRLVGHSWIYKDLCSQVLQRLNL